MNLKRYGEVSDGKRYHAVLERDDGPYYLASDVEQRLGELARLAEQHQRRADVLEKAIQGISRTIEQNNEQNGFWGIASAHGVIRQKAIEALEAAREIMRDNP